MKILRPILIALCASALMHLVAGLVWSEVLFFIAMASFPLAAFAALTLLLPLHLVFKRYKLEAPAQLAISLALGGAAGLLIHVALPARASLEFALQYASLGVLTALMCWVLYNWGPLKMHGAYAL